MRIRNHLKVTAMRVPKLTGVTSDRLSLGCLAASGIWMLFLAAGWVSCLFHCACCLLQPGYQHQHGRPWSPGFVAASHKRRLEVPLRRGCFALPGTQLPCVGAGILCDIRCCLASCCFPFAWVVPRGPTHLSCTALRNGCASFLTRCFDRYYY